MTIGFRIVGGQLTSAVQKSILDALSEATGIERGILELTVGVANNWRNSGVDDTDNDYVEIVVSLNSDSTEIMKAILENGGGKELGNQTVEFVKLEGTEYVVSEMVTTPSPIDVNANTTESPNLNVTDDQKNATQSANEDEGCVCAAVYDPVCCDGKEFGNACEASCDGFDADKECNSGTC